MNRRPPKDLIWSNERWFMTITIIFAVQVVVVIWLSGRAEIAVESERRRLIAYYQSPGFYDAAEPILELMDPSLYSRAKSHGFSGDAWLDVQPINHRSPGWKDEPQFLKFDEESLLDELESFGRAILPERVRFTSSMFRNQSNREPLSSHLRPVPESILEIRGGLTTADLTQPPDNLPVIEHDGVLQPSVVRIRVDQRGRVFSATLSARSGSSIADQSALKLSRALRFGHAEEFSVTKDANDFSQFRLATVRVRWWTVPVPVPPEPATEEATAPAGEQPIVDPVQ